MASRLMRAVQNATCASQAAAAAASRASRSARAAAAEANRAARLGSDIIAALDLNSCCKTKPREDDAPSYSCVDYNASAEYKQLPDNVKTPTEKDLESDEAVWALYERWCKAHDKDHDHADMARRFKIFRYYAKEVHWWNTHLPTDPKEASVYIRKRRKVKLLISKGQDATHFDERYHPIELGPFADGGDPCITERNERLLKAMEEREAVQDVTAH